MEIYVEVATQDAIDRLAKVGMAHANDLERLLPTVDERVQFAIQTTIDQVRHDVRRVQTFSNAIDNKRSF